MTPEEVRTEKRMKSLALANEIRVSRAAVKRKLKNGEEDPRLLLFSTPRELHGVTLVEFLMYVRGIGRHKARMMALSATGAPSVPTIRMEFLTDRIRRRVVAQLDEHFARRTADARREVHEAALVA